MRVALTCVVTCIVFAYLVNALTAYERPDRSIDQQTDCDAVFHGLDKTAYTPLRVPQGKIHVLIFTTCYCPIANSYAPEIGRLAKQYVSQGVHLFLVHTDPDMTDKEASEHRDEYQYKLPILIDREHQLVKAVGARLTPEAAVILPDRSIAYQGCIDDLFADLGEKRQQPRHRYLRLALDSLLAGQPITTARTKAIGCLIQVD